MSKIEKQVKLLLSEKFGLDISDISLNSSLTEDLGLDSLDGVELKMYLEKGSGFTIPDDQAEQMKTVGDVVAYLEANGCPELVFVGSGGTGDSQESNKWEERIKHLGRHMLHEGLRELLK